MAKHVNIQVDKGTDFSKKFIVLESDEETPLDLTDYSVYSQFRPEFGSKTVINFTAEITDATNGEITLYLYPDDTSALKAGRYLYDIVIVESLSNIDNVDSSSSSSEGNNTTTGNTTRVFEGILTLRDSVTIVL